MYYFYELDKFPLIKQFYSVTRNTVWQITDIDNILIFITEGTCSISFSNETYILNPGDVFFIPANHSYCRRSINNTMCTMYYIHFSFSHEVEQIDFDDLHKKISATKAFLDSQILNGAPLLSPENTIYLQNKISVKNHHDFFKHLNDIQLFSIKRQFMCGLQSSNSLCSILLALSQYTIDAIDYDTILKTPSKIPYNLKKAIRYIRSHYTEKISLDELADYCNVSKQQLIRYFHTSFHCTPVAYITDYKIARAKELLFNHPHLSIKEISDELGFNNQHYFTKVFIKSTGESPSNYRYRTIHYNDKK